MRAWACSGLLPSLTNSRPHTGISRAPCEPTTLVPSMIAFTCFSGKTTWLFRASAVRSVGLSLRIMRHHPVAVSVGPMTLDASVVVLASARNGGGRTSDLCKSGARCCQRYCERQAANQAQLFKLVRESPPACFSRSSPSLNSCHLPWHRTNTGGLQTRSSTQTRYA